MGVANAIGIADETEIDNKEWKDFLDNRTKYVIIILSRAKIRLTITVNQAY